ncbi:DUF2064 domain-containing protein [Pontibacter sp. G13]|uniref:TIGR04282 family arsenosugar biosynthesis glycosyltransferase n=1 Tax=Pontibacter sp. G13 TaxID=3074898 RepID=UPI0028896DF4|nr:DUF2064 domain-containing protein [Pontibacter sp. G13]WNJ20010.1 DUF2064 domain-containing protein [Pontibacter sp. G13]
MDVRFPIAILYFSRNARQEATAKSWLGHRSSRNETIAKALIDRTACTLQATGLPVFRFHEGNQQGETFGEKLVHAYQALFEQGFEAVISVGNDTPDLDQVDWDQIAERLARGELIIGPTVRGGTYLMGLTQSAFDAEQFLELPWQSRHLCEALVTSLHEAGHFLHELPHFRDLNSLQDLFRYIREHVQRDSTRRLLHRLLGSSATDTRVSGFRIWPILLTFPPFRGPPCPHSQPPKLQ